MYTKADLMEAIRDIGIKAEDTLLIHSSMKALGDVEGGADTVLDAFMEYMKPGLLIFPTHSWAQINEEHASFNPLTEPSCVGLLTNLFLKRPGVVRSWHPTHSVAAIGKEANSYVQGEERHDTPCSREGCWGKLYDRNAKILFLGCSLKRNTFLHSVEEWNHIPLRLADNYSELKILAPDGRIIDCPQHRHYSPYGDVSQNYDKMEAPFFHHGIARKGQIGDAVSVLCDAVGMADLTTDFLKKNPDLFADDARIPEEWYMSDWKTGGIGLKNEPMMMTFQCLPEVIEAYCTGIPEEVLDRRRSEEAWTIREHLYHIADVQEMLYARILTIRDEDKPVIKPYFPEKDTDKGAGYGSLQEAIAHYKAVRRKQIDLIRQLDQADYEKEAVHGEYMRYNIPIILNHMIFHEYWHMYRMEEIWLTRDEYFT